MQDQTETKRKEGFFRGAVLSAFLKGLVALIPTAVTILILVKVYQFLNVNVASVVSRALSSLAGREIPRIAGMGVAVGLVFLMGLLLASLIGRKVWSAAEGLLHRIPIVRFIYPSIKQITDFLLSERKLEFQWVVAVPYPRKETYSLGFVTGKGFRSVEQKEKVEYLTVFVPTAPWPMTGFVVLFRRDEVIRLPIATEDAMRFIISGGLLTPPAELSSLSEPQPILPASEPKEPKEKPGDH